MVEEVTGGFQRSGSLCKGTIREEPIPRSEGFTWDESHTQEVGG